MGRLVKKIAGTKLKEQLDDIAKSKGDLVGSMNLILTEKVEDSFSTNKKCYQEAREWYNLAMQNAGITSTEPAELAGIKAFWNDLQVKQRTEYETASNVYLAIFEKEKNAHNPNNIDDNFTNNIGKLFKSFSRFMDEYPVSKMSPTTSVQTAQVFSCIIQILSYAVKAPKTNSNIQPKNKALYACEIKDLLDMQLFQDLEKLIPNKKQSTPLTEAIKATLKLAQESFRSIPNEEMGLYQEAIINGEQEFARRLAQY